MSSLLDVLHKRPSRAQLAAADTLAVAAVPESAAEPAPPELHLAAEPLAADAAEPVERTQAFAQGHAGGETTQMRRWLDPPGAVPPAAPVDRAASRPGAARRPVLLPALLLASAAFAGFLVYEFSGQEQESFLAAPPADLPPPGVTAATPPAPPAAVAERRPVRRPPPAPAEPAEEAVTGGDLAWYDQPALPAAAAEEPEAQIRITRGTESDPVYDTLRAAWSALQSGEAAQAEALYREALAADPNSIDARLGLGSLAARGGRVEEARDLYRQVQRLDPKNGTAAAALAVLPGGPPRATDESRLKDMLREQPGSAALHFALGLRYAGERRWPDAQAAFFEAVRHEPTNADYAFNLAVSLDQLGQAPAAASYYQRALDLAAGSQQFDAAAARARLEALRGRRG